ncbi:MAG TPA: hypothetical protein VK856_14290 [Anaerolineaceae bacterium]|nr:hypothetical protein [Anaerolineaceae bacterium]
MKNWFFSLKGSIVLATIALLSEVWRGFLDAMFVFPVDFGDEALMNLAAVIFTLLFAGWAWMIIIASKNNRKGLIATFIINFLILLMGPISWYLFYCPIECRAGAGIFNLANILNLVFGVLAAISLGYQILTPKRKKINELVMEV